MVKKIFLFVILAVTMLPTLYTAAYASAAPVYGGKSIFVASDFKLTNADNNGNFVPYRCTIDTVKENGVDVVKITAANEAKTALLDFSYYQWNYSEYLPALNTSEYKFLKIKYKRADSDSSEFQFFKADEAALNTTGASGNTTIKMENDGKWHTVTVDLSAAVFTSATKWTDKNLRQFRLYPWAQVTADKNANKVFYIEYVGFFKTQAEADAYAGPAEAAKQVSVSAASTKAASASASSGSSAVATVKAAQTADMSAVMLLPAAAAAISASLIAAKKSRKH